MEMCVKGALEMPKNYAVMDNEEMMYNEGGAELDVSRSYLNKMTCEKVAGAYVAATGLGQARLKKEIYAHAVMYYASYASLPAAAAMLMSGNVGLGAATLSTLYWIRDHSQPIHLGGDSSFRVKVYEAIWKYM